MNLEKRRARNAKYRAANPEKVAAGQAAWRAANPEYNAAYYMANAEEIKADVAAYRAANPEKIKVGQAAWRVANSEKARARQAKYQASGKSSANARMRRYGMSPEAFQLMCSQQKNACGICKEAFSGEQEVDHCHATGEIRGLLCGRCNKGLGLLKDSLEILENAKEYLRTVKLGKTKG